MKLKINYFLIPLCVFIVAWVGSWLTSRGMNWYKTINLPDWTPPGSIIGVVWTVIFILTAVSAIVFWNKAPHNSRFIWFVIIFILNGFLNIFWSYLFFNRHWLGAAVAEAALLCLTVIALIILVWPVSRIAAILLVPYASWVAFATYLNYIIWNINK